VVASRLQETEVFHVTGSFVTQKVAKTQVAFQTSLF